MTDPKPATPAIDRKPCPFCGINVPFVQDPSTKFIDSSWIEHPNNGCRIGRKMYVPEWNTRPQEAAAAETIKAKEQEIVALMFEKTPLFLTIDIANLELAEARETIRKQAEEIERLKDSSWLYASMEEKNHNLKLLYDKSNRQEAELATLREQVETLREALKMALGHCDCSDYHGKALIPCTEAHPCAGCHTTRTGQAALAATEPKG